MSDLKYAFRQLATRRGFSIIVILTLALGIGMNSAFFSVINAALLKDLGVRAPEEVMNVYTTKTDGTGYGALSYPDYRDLRDANVFGSVAGYSGLMATFTLNGQAETLFGELVTGNYFSTLGIVPQRGRFFFPEEDRTPLTHPVAVLGDAFWRRKFAANPDIVGQTIALNGRQYTVVGVAPETFSGSLLRGFNVDVWVPTMMMGALRTDQLENRGERWMFVKGRLKEGSSDAQAATAVATLASRLASDFPETNERRQMHLIPSTDVRVSAEGDGAIVPAAVFMLAAVGIVLLVACTNLASLMLARASSRRREVAVRTALGATRARIVRHMVMESAVLAVAGGVLGLVFAHWMASLLMAFKPPLPVALNFDVSIDARVVAYTILLTAFTTVMFGLLPALAATRGDLSAAMKQTTGATSARARRYGLRNLMLVPQVSFSLLLLVIAGLFGRSVANAAAVPVGVDLDRTAMIAFNLAPSGYDEARARAFYDRLRERMLAIPGVQSVAVTDRIPLDLYGSQSSSLRLDSSTETDEQSVQFGRVEADYFPTVGVPIVRGRAFTKSEVDAGRNVAVISEAAAGRYFGGRDAIGQRIKLGDEDDPWLEVIGVAANAKVQSLGEAPEPFVYQPLSGGYPRLLRIIARTNGDSRALLTAMRSVADEVDPMVAMFESKTMSEHLNVMLFPFRSAAALSSALGIFALVLAAVGLYGVLAFSVAERSRELAIRIALGAKSASVLRLVVADGTRVVAIGVMVGMAMAFAASQLLASWVFGISTTDPLTFVLVPAMLLLVAVVASVVPARRATTVDPLQVMKE